MNQLQFIDGILQPSRLSDALPRMSIVQLAACADASRTLGLLAIDKMGAPEFGGFCEADQSPAGEWMEGMGLTMIEAADRCIAELRSRRPNNDQEAEARARALLQFAAATNEPVAVMAALAVSLAVQEH